MRDLETINDLMESNAAENRRYKSYETGLPKGLKKATIVYNDAFSKTASLYFGDVVDYNLLKKSAKKLGYEALIIKSDIKSSDNREGDLLAFTLPDTNLAFENARTSVVMHTKNKNIRIANLFQIFGNNVLLELYHGDMDSLIGIDVFEEYRKEKYS